MYKSKVIHLKIEFYPYAITVSRLGAGIPAAHREIRLMLLGPPPDMVHGARLRGTHPSTLRKTALS